MGWTEQQIQTLKKMWGHGYSASDIAKNLGNGMTRNAVIGKAHRLKLSVGPGAVASHSIVEAPSKVGGSVLSTITKVARKRTMLRPLPSVQTPDGISSPKTNPMIREPQARPIEQAKRSEGIAVLKAGERHCRWPIGDPRSPDFRFCGCSAVEGLPYCPEHARMAYQTISRRGRANDVEPVARTDDEEEKKNRG